MRHRVHQKIFFISCLLLVFFLPVYPKAVPTIIVILLLNWLLSGVYIKIIRGFLREKWRLYVLAFSSLYLLYLAGMLYSTDLSYGWFDLEVKLSLLIFPLVFATSDLQIFNFNRTRILYGSFISGCVAGSLLLSGHTWIVNDAWGVPDAYYYTNLTWYFHPSYLSMYYVFGVGIALYYLDCSFSKHSLPKTIILAFVIFYLEVFIFLLSSKAGLISLLMTQALFVLFLIVKRTGFARIIIVSILFGSVFMVYWHLFPYAFKRISKADSVVSSSHTFRDNPNDGTVARMEIWKVSMGIILKNFIFGVGTGDVKNELMKSYKQHHLDPIFRKKLNAHCQYIQTFIALGFTGFSLLILTLFWPGYCSFRRGEYLYTLFILIFAMNILFESMFETQAGVVFYAFFNALMFSLMRGRNT